MKNKIQYPSSYELEHVFSEFCSADFINSFAQSKGIILIRQTKERLAADLANYYFDKSDIVNIREAAHRKTSKHSVAGFILNVPNSQFDPATAMQEIRTFYGNNENVRLEPIKKEREDLYTGKVSYKSFKPGRVELLQGEEVSFDYSLQKITDNSYQVFVDGSKSNDSKKFEDILKKNISKDGVFELMNFDNFNTSQAISFFDELANRFEDENWKFKQVKHLIIKRVKNREEEEIEASNEDLSGITQAILEGNNLRENSFVKQSESDGYTFTAMAYEFDHTKKPYVVRIKADFKSRPKVFEVSIIGYMKREGIVPVLVDTPIEKSLEYEINTNFWKVAKSIYDQLTTGSRTLVKAEE